VAPIDFTETLACPLLRLFGKEDTRQSPADMAQAEAALKRFGKTYEFHSYENAGHAFFSVDRPSYRPEAAVDGCKKVFDWFGRYLT
jgi:carboxymethylenebutenolidase